jgi:hypothetical protein
MTNRKQHTIRHNDHGYGGSSLSRGEMRYRDGLLYFTQRGLSILGDACVGSPGIDELADIFCVEISDIERLIAPPFNPPEGSSEKPRPAGQAYETYRRATAAGRVALRAAQMSLATENAAMAKTLGKIHLGQSEKDAPETGDMPVIGMTPDYTKSSGDWLKDNAEATKNADRDVIAELRERNEQAGD